MHFHNLDLNQLVALDALLTEKNVTRAGQRVHLSQSAVSVILGRLREYFHNELLVPSGRNMVLTPLARSLAQPVRNCLLQIQHTIASKAGFDPATAERTFSLAASDYVTAVLMPEVLQLAARQAPGITFKFASMDGPLEDQLENGDIDFLIRPSIYGIANHPKEELFEETHTCVVWTKNSLVGRKLTREQYFGLGHVGVGFRHRPAFFEEWFATRYGPVRKIEVVVANFEAACRFVVGTNRIATIFTRMAKLCSEHMPLKIVRPPIPIPAITEVAQWNRYQDQDPGHIWFRGLLKQTAKQRFSP